MNRLKEIRPLTFLACLMIGIALVIGYSMSSAIITDDKPVKEISKSSDQPENNEKVLSVGQTSSEDQYIASRGEYDRLAAPAAQAKPETAPVVKPTAPAAVKPAAPAVKPTAPAPAKTEAAPVKVAAKAASQYDSDVDVLARLIMAEAQAEPYEAKVAVGAVVINRVQSGQWADSIREVIYQKSGGYYQFTPVQNGWIDKPADAECIKAAKAALSGADPTNGAQFYYDDSVTNEWILAKPVSTQIGHMTYAY